MRISTLLIGLLSVLSLTAHGQTIVWQLDVTKFPLGRVVGVPQAIDTDDDPLTPEWLVRYEDQMVPWLRATFASVVVRGGRWPCVGVPFLYSDDESDGGILQHDGRTLHVRTGQTLTVYRLDPPGCHH